MRSLTEHMEFDMLAFAITTFFILALFGASAVIGTMFWQYREKIEAVVSHGLGVDQSANSIRTAQVHSRPVQARQIMNRQPKLKPAALRAAA